MFSARGRKLEWIEITHLWFPFKGQSFILSPENYDFFICNPSVTGAIRYELWSDVKAKRFPGLGVRSVRLESGGGGFFIEGAGAKASRRLRRIRVFSESLPIPANASGAYRPNPQATTKLPSDHP